VKCPIDFKYRFEILVPLADNEGRRFAPSKIQRVGETLLAHFTGCRCQPFAPYLGMWKFGDDVYREALLLFTVDAPREDQSLDWMLSFKKRLKQQFGQIEIYMAVTELLWL
jgi:hypothetical protein